MSGDLQLATSFGAQPPPTPPHKGTPITTVFPSPVFETPRSSQDNFDRRDSSGWTPNFAEEYSVFNATPGNLRGSPRAVFDGQFAPFALYQPPPSAGQKRRLSAEGIAEEIAAHATHFSPNPNNLPLPPVEPSRRLPSSPGPLVLPNEQAQSQLQVQTQLEESPREVDHQGRATKKPRLSPSVQQGPEQIATPPPSARKGVRKLAPKLDTVTMQHDQAAFGDFLGEAAQHGNMGTAGFMHSPGDMFGGFHMSAPASAPVLTDAQHFWAGMDIDLSGATPDFLQTPVQGHHRPAGSLDWGRDNQIFQETGFLPQQPQQHQQQQPQDQQQQQSHQQQHQQQQHQQNQPQNLPPTPQQQQSSQQSQEPMPPAQAPQPARRERPLAPKTMMPAVDTGASGVYDQSFMDTSMYQTSTENPFGINASGVNPGLLLSRPPSSSMQAAVFNPMQQPPNSSTPVAAPTVQVNQGNQGGSTPLGLGISKAPMRAELRRSMSVKETGPSKQPSKGASVSSPIKSGGRPGLSRSFSENRGKRTLGRVPSLSASASQSSSLPVLAPSLKTLQPAPGNPAVNSSRPSSHGSRSSGRSSPPKAHQHHRLSSLTSIPESLGPQSRASVKFTIDANGRARVETIMVEDDVPVSLSLQRRQSAQALASKPQWDSTEDEESSTDDEEIIIPSRNTSFALPDPLKVSGSRARGAYHHGSQNSFSGHSTTSSSLLPGEQLSQDDYPESEAETVMDVSPSGEAAGNALGELERLKQTRRGFGGSLKMPKAPSPAGRQRFASDAFSNNRAPPSQYRSSATISPTTLTDASLPTPSTESRHHRVRCVCNSADAHSVGDGGFMVQCETCDMWLHGKCLNITRKSMPSVYICVYCTRTPNGRSGGRTLSASSPLAHKSSFPQKFR